MTLKTKRDVEEAKCNLEALYEMSDLGGSYEPPPTVDDHQDEDVGFERMEPYVNSLEKGSYSSAPVQDCDLKTENKSESGPPHRQLNVGAEPFNPQKNRNTYSEFAKVFAKKDLVSKIHLFYDNPENFSSWKASFKNAVRELSLTPMEEMDLLIQWLCNTASVTQAKSIRKTKAANPERGLQRI